jgi:integral membrane protein
VLPVSAVVYRMNPIRRLRLLAFWEGISLLVLLFIAMPLKYLADQPMAVRVVGILHGVLLVMKQARWSLGRGALVFVSTVLPFGAFFMDRKMRAYETEMTDPSRN